MRSPENLLQALRQHLANVFPYLAFTSKDALRQKEDAINRAAQIISSLKSQLEAQAAEIERLRADFRDETKSHAETAGFLQERKDHLASIRSTLAAALGVEGEADELAKLAGKVIPELAMGISPIDCKRSTLNRAGFWTCEKCNFEEDSPECVAARVHDTAVEAAKGGSDEQSA